MKFNFKGEITQRINGHKVKFISSDGQKLSVEIDGSKLSKERNIDLTIFDPMEEIQAYSVKINSSGLKVSSGDPVLDELYKVKNKIKSKYCDRESLKDLILRLMIILSK